MKNLDIFVKIYAAISTLWIVVIGALSFFGVLTWPWYFILAPLIVPLGIMIAFYISVVIAMIMTSLLDWNKED